MGKKLKDIVEIPNIDLVINIEDIDNNRDNLYQSFVLTDEVFKALKIILEKIYKNKGSGIFVKGNFGSGKSHFLSYLYIILNDCKKIKDNFPEFKNFPHTNTKKILLTKYPSSRSLESIILEYFDYQNKVLNRDEVFKKCINKPTVIIIDELSEFLRSKENPASFYEDVRFLQYLGEYSFNNPLWIVASLQEWIEDTGHISSSMFNRIKDRYPIKINLTSSHIEDIIDKRIVLKKRGAEKFIEEVFNNFKNYYPNFKISFDNFKKTYPLHPITVKFLSGLTPIFSQHRGVIHFVVNEVKLNLEKPYDYLITADKIYDNFEDRIREIPDYTAFVTSVYLYYKQNIDSIIKNDKLTETALSIIKILILTEISPSEKRKNYREIAEILLKKFSTFNENINYEFVKDGILEPLVQNRMFLKKDGETYFIDASIKEVLKIKADIKKETEKFHNKEFLFKTILKNLKYNFLPLNNVLEGRKVKFIWQNTQREAVILPIFKVPQKYEFERFLSYVAENVDGYLCIISPFIEEYNWIKSLKELFNDNQYLKLILFWQLSPFSDYEINFIINYFSKINLKHKYNELSDEIKKEELEFKEIVTDKFFKGKIISGDNQVILNLEEAGILPFEKFLKTVFDTPLNSVHYKHFEIMPLIDYVPKAQLTNLFNNFILKGKISFEDANKKGFFSLIENFLNPLGIIKKKNENFYLKIDVNNELISNILNVVNHEQNIFNLRTIFKKGKWGLTYNRFYILISVLIVSGYLIPFNEFNEPVDFKDINQFFKEIQFLKQGKTINHKYLPYIKNGAFIWGETEDVPTFVTQKHMWKEVSKFIREYRKKISEIEKYIDKYQDYTIFSKIRLDESLINNLKIFLNSIKLTGSPSEQLEAFLAYLKENPEFQNNIEYLDSLFLFFNKEFHQINRIYLYLTDNALILPEEIENKRKRLLIEIDEYLYSFQEFEKLIIKWNDFYEDYFNFYQEAHDKFYSDNIFNLKELIESTNEFKILNKISFYVPELTFKYDFYEINSMLKKLPEKCNENLSAQLFSSPVCKCGFVINQEPPEINIDFQNIIKEGIKNFISQINLPENREKIETFLIGEENFKDEVMQILYLNNISTINLELILPFINDNTLKIIAKALKGKWKIKELNLKEKLKEIEGKRLKYSELKDFFQKLIGDDLETIFWITESSQTYNNLKESLAKYSVEGTKLYNIIINSSDIFKELNEHINELNLKSFKDEELIKFLDSESFAIIKKHIRNEILQRLLINKFQVSLKSKDHILNELLNFFNLINSKYKFKGVKIFQNVVAPLNLSYIKLMYENQLNDYFNKDLFDKVSNLYNSLIYDYENSQDIDKYDGILYIENVLNQIDSNLFIFDALRFDLWILIKNELIQSGFKVFDYPMLINWHTDTFSFREMLKNKNILKWGEHITGKRQIKKISKNDIVNFNFIDEKIHSTTLDLYPLFTIILDEFKKGILPILKNFQSFYLLSDHGFVDTEKMKNRYIHGGNSFWERIVPFAKVVM